MSLRFIALSGTTSVTHNLYIYEQKGEMMIVDCGVGFPDLEMQGVELVIPDFAYVLKNKHKIKGILISQAHEDHHGALPFLLKDISVPVYASPLTSEFIKDKLEEYGVRGKQINTFNPDQDTITIGSFKITPFRVNHSVPDTCGFAIDTSQGRVFHVPEHKFDPEPVDRQQFDVSKANKLAKEKSVLFLASDCLGANKPGKTPTEKSIEENLYKVMKPARSRIFFTTISSNIGRIQQALNVAKRLNRKAVLVGRSITRKAEIARSLGYLKYKQNQVTYLRPALKMNRNNVLFIIAGCYGQEGSSLYRVATNKHQKIFIEKGDMVVFSADPAPPYTKESEDFVIDGLTDLGVDVHYYDLKEGLYVSGHGYQDDIVRLFDITRPKYFLPIGGTIRFMNSYRKLAESFGASPNSIFELKPGDSLIFESGKVRKGQKIPVKDVMVHGLGIGDIGRVVLSDRNVLGKEGIAVVSIKIEKKSKKLLDIPEITSRGFVFEREEKKFLRESAEALAKELKRQKKLNSKNIKNTTVNFLTEHFQEKLARRPMILPVIVEV